MAKLRAHLVNPVVRVLLRSPAHRLLSGSLLLLECTGRRSGRRYVLPVAYAPSGTDLLVLVGRPTTKTWWRNFDARPQPVTVRLRGRREPASARLLTAGAGEHDRALHAYRQRFPRAAAEVDPPVLVLTPG